METPTWTWSTRRFYPIFVEKKQLQRLKCAVDPFSNESHSEVVVMKGRAAKAKHHWHQQLSEFHLLVAYQSQQNGLSNDHFSTCLLVILATGLAKRPPATGSSRCCGRWTLRGVHHKLVCPVMLRAVCQEAQGNLLGPNMWWLPKFGKPAIVEKNTEGDYEIDKWIIPFLGLDSIA